MKRLINDEILPDLDFLDFDTYVDCIKGKLTSKLEMARLTDAPSCLGLFIHLLLGYSLLLLWMATNFSSHSLMIIPVMVFSSSFVRSLNLWRLSKLSKLKLSSKHRRRSKWFILTEVVSIMVDMMRWDGTLDHLQSIFRNMTLMFSIQCLVLLNRIGFQRGGIACFLIWCDVCLLISHHLSFCRVKL